MFRIVCRGLSVSSRRRMDPIQAIFVNKIRSYADQSAAIGGPGSLTNIQSKLVFIYILSRS